MKQETIIQIILCIITVISSGIIAYLTAKSEAKRQKDSIKQTIKLEASCTHLNKLLDFIALEIPCSIEKLCENDSKISEELVTKLSEFRSLSKCVSVVFPEKYEDIKSIVIDIEEKVTRLAGDIRTQSSDVIQKNSKEIYELLNKMWKTLTE